MKYVADNGEQLGGTGWGMDQFSWDNKYAGVQLKASKVQFICFLVCGHLCTVVIELRVGLDSTV